MQPSEAANISAVGGLAALHFAARQGAADTARVLVEAGDGEGFAGNAHRFAPSGMLAAVKYLIEDLGTNPNVRDADGHTALHHAASQSGGATDGVDESGLPADLERHLERRKGRWRQPGAAQQRLQAGTAAIMQQRRDARQRQVGQFRKT